MNKGLIFALVATVITVPAAATGNGGTPSSVSSSATGAITNTNKSSSSSKSVSKGGSATATGGRSRSTAVGIGQGGAGGAATATGGQGGVGVGSQGQTTHVEGDSTYVEAARRAAASAYAAPLTSSNDTCMGSSSGGVQVPGAGVSFGTTWTDKNCVMLKNAREMWNMGLKSAALARMCMDDDNKTALEQSGITCPETKKTEVVESSTYTGSDPYVRRRLGLDR